MTDEQLDEIEKLAEAATPGPWKTVVDEFHADSGAHQVALHDCFTEQDADKNAAFIRAMREHALPLVKELRAAREVLGLILSVDALQHWAFEADDDGESIYDMVRRAAGKEPL